MAESNKPLSEYDANQIQQKVYNKEGATLSVAGFLAGQVGRRIVKVNTSATVETISYYENQTDLLYTYQITYTDASKADFAEAERIA